MIQNTSRPETEGCGGDIYMQHDNFGARVYCGKCGAIIAGYGFSNSSKTAGPLKLSLSKKHE